MKKILLVDDHPRVRVCIRSILDGLYKVCGEAVDGHEAIEKATELRPDLILMDVNMPVMNGLDASRLIRSLLPGVKIALFTLHDGREMEHQAKAAGADVVITKGAKPKQIVEMLDRLLSNGAEPLVVQPASGETLGRN